MSDGGVMDVLVEGHQLTRQLESHLNDCCSMEYCRTMVHGILAAWEKLMYMANPIADLQAEPPLPLTIAPTANFEQPEMFDSIADLPTYQQPFVGQEQQKHRLSKKRKTPLPTRTAQLRSCSPGVAPAVSNDGFSWRKYGHKEILGFSQPRCYYRCTHRYTQNCVATKYLQRSEHDESVYEVTYNGNHTCIRKTKTKSSPRTAADTIPATNPHFDLDILQRFKKGLRIKTESSVPGSDLDTPSSTSGTSASYLTPIFTSTPSPLGDDGFTFGAGNFSNHSSLMSTPTGATAEEAGNSFWAEPFSTEHELLGGVDMAVSSYGGAVPYADNSTEMAAGVDTFFIDDMLDVDPVFPDLLSEILSLPPQHCRNNY